MFNNKNFFSMDNNERSVLTLKLGRWRTMEWRDEAVDPSLDDIFDGFYGCLIGHEFDPETVVCALREWAEEKCKTMKQE